MMTFSEAVKTCITKKFFTISGRASRAEYWWFQLFTWISVMVVSVIGAALVDGNGGEIFMGLVVIVYLILMIPNFCVRIRRLHDTGHSGWNILWACIPYIGLIGGIYLLILECTNSEPGENKYGPSPSLSNENFCTDNSSSPIKEENENEDITDVTL